MNKKLQKNKPNVKKLIPNNRESFLVFSSLIRFVQMVDMNLIRNVDNGVMLKC
jgi:hypothetical protein